MERGGGRCTAAREVQRRLDEHERGGDLEVMPDGNTQVFAQKVIKILEREGRWGW